MPPSAEAQKNHDELFPGHISTLKVTDPDLIEYFDNFAFDEILRHGSLDTRTRLMVQLASLIACQALSEYRVMLGAALTVGVAPIQVKEIVYQAVPYVGMGKVLDFLHATNDVLTERGIELPLEAQSTTTPQTRAEKGLAVQKQIVGDELVDRMYASAPEDEKHIRRLLSANCFGDHYTRTGIDVNPTGDRRDHRGLIPTHERTDMPARTWLILGSQAREGTLSVLRKRIADLEPIRKRFPSSPPDYRTAGLARDGR